MRTNKRKRAFNDNADMLWCLIDIKQKAPVDEKMFYV